jgi:hypothetical protein
MLSNLPITMPSSDAATEKFQSYSSSQIEVNPTILAAITGFFNSRGFNEISSETIASIIYSQAKNDGYNPMQILDTLKTLEDIELSALVSEILNYNRFKSSNLGIAEIFSTNEIISRNIIL